MPVAPPRRWVESACPADSTAALCMAAVDFRSDQWMGIWTCPRQEYVAAGRAEVEAPARDTQRVRTQVRGRLFDRTAPPSGRTFRLRRTFLDRAPTAR